MDGVRIPVERFAALLKWKTAGEVLIPGVLKVKDIDKMKIPPVGTVNRLA